MIILIHYIKHKEEKPKLIRITPNNTNYENETQFSEKKGKFKNFRVIYYFDYTSMSEIIHLFTRQVTHLFIDLFTCSFIKNIY